MRGLRHDQSGQMAVGDILKLALQILPWIEKFVKAVKKAKEKYSYIPLWHGKYVYHIQERKIDYLYDERNHTYNYLDTEDLLKKFGFVFGNEKEIGGGITDIGVYAFLPFAKIAEFYGDQRLEDKTIKQICNSFEENIQSQNKKKIIKASAEARLLLKFLLEKGCNERFPELLINPKGHFSEFYKELLKRLSNMDSPTKMQTLEKFVMASLLGMYGSSKGFYTALISTKISEVGGEIERIAAMVNGKSYALVSELGEKGFVKQVRDRLVATFEPQTSAKALESIFGGLPSTTMVFLERARFFKLEALFEAFRDLIRDFDKERVPIFLNVYRDEAAKVLRSVCAAYNRKAKKKIQQIKYPRAEAERMDFGQPLDRFVHVIRKYRIEI